MKQPCFSLLVSFKISGLFSGHTWEYRLSFRHLTLPRHAATAFTSSSQRSQGQQLHRGSGTVGQRVLFTSSLLMCGLVCFNWHVALRALACRLLVLWVNSFLLWWGSVLFLKPKKIQFNNCNQNNKISYHYSHSFILEHPHKYIWSHSGCNQDLTQFVFLSQWSSLLT